MAEGAFIEVVEVVIGKSGNLADQIGLSSCVKDELEKLRTTVSTIKPVVPDAEERQERDYYVSDWLGRLKVAVYAADNLLEEFSNEVLRRDQMTQDKEAKKVCISFPKLNQLAFDLKMGHKIKAVRKSLDAITADRMLLNLEERLRETQVEDWERETHSFVGSEEIIGREDDKKAIIKILLAPNVNENVAVLRIVGSGGLGKTTLAQLVYNDEEISKHFEIKSWVCVGYDFDIRIIAQKILECVTFERKEALEKSTLIDELHQVIDKRRYLLVLDDVWNEDNEKWVNLMGVLQSRGSGSRILVTTRSDEVARITKTNETYSLRELSPHDSWLLFERYAFNEREEPDFEIKEIGKEIVKKCRGVPLAIKSMGLMLYCERRVEKWSFCLNSDLSEFEPWQDGFLSTLKLSYYRLPAHLKQCCAYCSLFPKDYNINKQTLIRLWMAQGFIKLSHSNQCLEDVGHDYFMVLRSRSFFQEVEEDKRGNTSFKIHDFMHDLLTRVTGQGSAIIGINGEHIADAERTHHLSLGFHLVSSSLTNTLFQAINLRTFLLCGQQLGEHENGLKESTCDEIFSRSKFLRVLDLHGTGIKTVPSSISKLNCVRYLDLSDNRLIEMLPQSLSRLQNLQTLKLSGCVRLKELPRDISKLVNLRVLEIDGCRDLIHMPCGLGKLTNLRTLSQFVISKDTSSVSRNNGKLEELNRLDGELKELNTLNNLRGTLEIVNLRRGKDAEAESMATNLRGMEHLQGLKLRWIEDEVDKAEVDFDKPSLEVEDEVDKAEVDFDKPSLEALQPQPNLKLLSLYRYMGEGFPNWLSSLKNLVEFSLFGCKKCQNLSLLYQFPSLKVLELDSLSALEYISDSEEFSNSSFLSSLEELKIKYCPNLKGWKQRGDSIDDDNSTEIATTTTTMPGNHMPPSFSRLSKLCIRACPQLVSMPLFPFLENLELYYCSFKPLEETTKIAAAEVTDVASTSSSTHATSSSNPLSKLKSMEIGRMEEPLPEECMQNLISLDRLWIYECRGPLLQGIQHLAALKRLEICSSEVLDLFNWEGLRSLKSLWLFQLLNLESLPEGIQYVTSLENLTIDYCPCLTALPEWIFSLPSLKILEILQCPKLQSLPVGISRLTSLHTLKIRYCPILSQRCKKEKVRDWPQISHITNLDLEPENSDGEPNEQQKKFDLLRIKT